LLHPRRQPAGRLHPRARREAPAQAAHRVAERGARPDHGTRPPLGPGAGGQQGM